MVSAFRPMYRLGRAFHRSRNHRIRSLNASWNESAHGPQEGTRQKRSSAQVYRLLFCYFLVIGEWAPLPPEPANERIDLLATVDLRRNAVRRILADLPIPILFLPQCRVLFETDKPFL